MKRAKPLSDDWMRNWQASIAVKITAVVMWVIIPFGFLIALFWSWNAEERIGAVIIDDVEILLNSARVLLADNNSYNKPEVVAALDKQLQKSVFCKLILAAQLASQIVLEKEHCSEESLPLVEKTYYFTSVFAGSPEEIRMSLYRESSARMLNREKANRILQMIGVMIFFGLVLIWIIRLLVLKPLLNMVDTARLISDGRNDIRIQIGQHDEFGYLASFLNQMLDNLFEQQNNLKQTNLKLMKEIAQRNRIALELRTHRDQLEQLIRERTLDLAIARDQALDANRAKSLFLTNMSHEIRTSLNVILGYSQLLQRSHNLDPRQQKSIDIIERSGQSLLDLLNDILDFSNIEAGKMKLNKVNFDLNELIHSIANVFSERCAEKGLQWQSSNGLRGQILIESDAQKLRQILFNLLGNAVKFTDHGKVCFNVSNLSGNQYYFEITDTGPGIPPESREIIFDAFEKEDSEQEQDGLGLGLAIARKQLEFLDGELKLTSSLGEGSKFSFALQLESARVGFEIRKDRNNEVIQLAQRRVINLLVVDDVELSRLLLADILSEINASVKAVKNGLEAIELIHDAEEKDKPDIVFMDIHMPVMDGMQAMRKIKQQYGDQIICVALTASFMEYSEMNYLTAGFDDYISRPYRFEDVFDCLQRHLQVDLENNHQLKLNKNPDVLFTDENINIDLQLCNKIINASQRYALNEIKHYLLILEACGTEEKQLARKITRLMSLYDMDGIEELLTHACETYNLTAKKSES